MREQFIRTEMLLGAEALARLQNARVALFGLGGVGGYTLEALARSGVGQLDLIDNDTVSLSNLNRQILATYDTVGMRKVDAAKQRVLSINPDCVVRTYAVFYTPETAGQFDFTQYDYIVDAIDTVTGKLALVQNAHDAGTPIISCMGTGNKLDASAFEVADITKTSMCPLARVMRQGGDFPGADGGADSGGRSGAGHRIGCAGDLKKQPKRLLFSGRAALPRLTLPRRSECPCTFP